MSRLPHDVPFSSSSLSEMTFAWRESTIDQTPPPSSPSDPRSLALSVTVTAAVTAVVVLFLACLLALCGKFAHAPAASVMRSLSLADRQHALARALPPCTHASDPMSKNRSRASWRNRGFCDNEMETTTARACDTRPRQQAPPAAQGRAGGRHTPTASRQVSCTPRVPAAEIC